MKLDLQKKYFLWLEFQILKSQIFDYCCLNEGMVLEPLTEIIIEGALHTEYLIFLYNINILNIKYGFPINGINSSANS